MVNIGNEGSVIIESMIVVTIVLLILSGLTLVWIHTFEYEVGVMQAHEAVLNNQTYDVEVTFRWFDYMKVKSYQYKKNYHSIGFIQRVFRSILYFVETYFDRLSIKK